MTRSLRSLGTGNALRPLVLILAATVCLPAFTYQIVDLGADVAPKDVNNFGLVVGSRNTSQYPSVAFRYDLTTGQFEDLDGTIAHAANDLGQIAGSTLTGAFFLDGNSMHTWDEQGAYGISETGLVAGNKAGKNPYRATSIPWDPAVYEGNKWSVMNIAQVYPRGTRQGVYADVYALNDVNDSGFTVGSRRRYGLAGSSAIMIAPPYNAVGDGADVTYLPSPAGGSASAINNRNIILGTSGSDSRNGIYATAFIHDGVELTLLEPLAGGLSSSGLDINESDTVVGSSASAGLNHAFIWDAAAGTTDLNNLISDPNWVLVAATAINDNGDIVGTGQLNGQNHGFLLVNGSAPPPPPVQNDAPVAVAEASVTVGKAPLNVDFFGGDSYDNDGEITAYEWSFGDARTSAKMNTQGVVYSEPGTYLVSLTVTDDDGAASGVTLEIIVRKGGRKKKN